MKIMGVRKSGREERGGKDVNTVLIHEIVKKKSSFSQSVQQVLSSTLQYGNNEHRL